MAHPFPLQPADEAPDYSGVDSSEAADKRDDSYKSALEGGPGSNAAPSYKSPQGDLWRAGQLAPAQMTPPYSTILDTPEGDRVHEIDCSKYGDAYDPKVPYKVRQVTDWSFDPDNDGDLA